MEFEERADQLSAEEISTSLAEGETLRKARQKLLATGAKFLVGPRGTGKTHLMRFTYSHALTNKNHPLTLYSSFNKYLHLEPLLKKTPDALKRFHSWVLAKILISAFDYINDLSSDSEFLKTQDPIYDEDKLRELVSLLERGSGVQLYEEYGQFITVDHVIRAVRSLTAKFNRSRAVLLLDDAALSLSDQYLIAFFEVFRVLKVDGIAPKASVYPGSTQYGPTFHTSHEVEEVPLWLSVEDSAYSSIMGDIANRRLSSEQQKQISPDVLELFKYTAFGIPRVFLRLLREYFSENAGTSQSKVNKIIEHQVDLIGAEYDSLALKLKQFTSVIQTGREFFNNAISDISSFQASDLTKRNIVLGILQNAERTPLAERMIKFLIEVGMLYPLQSVSHGQGRKYDRYIPHMAFLYQAGAFREGKRNTFKGLPEVMIASPAKHPLRREFKTLLKAQGLANLKLDLPPCQKCGTQRFNDSQLFCHNCGEELVGSSLFEECMKLPLSEVPGMSRSLISRIHEATNIRSIADVITVQNASSELQKANYVGPRRAEQIINKVELTVEEFLS
ncbi:zinc ribbon domain-containing protein [Pseudomonas aeruginosa]|uniref:zinc ribbon domain-containing protein n=1 Tax=Pseudomonas aeruginosa TaxID=287 RepID=UPI0004452A85|nr:zinc ribbon domain-containing protein [Pseudomonas aeruginosa]EZO93518.1 hypothetical protein V555_03882 [Pseudomonas aeruginosa BWH054]MBO3770947.1 zinc ribbon domain-containing protein [Pseudomonas aeruginosa]MBW6237775.1 zinc ribbon domain-containing protein [Pseudomonas aeruginosa]MBX5859490.1 zinc ribbon domain-containing protein [Pseudomonas aeruginosa]MCD2808819.1 zinc ribbon domain-containing protein [Pseudomonas aeruginosa]